MNYLALFDLSSLFLYCTVFGVLFLFNILFILFILFSYYWIDKYSLIYSNYVVYKSSPGLLLNLLRSILSYNHINFKALLGWEYLPPLELS